MKIFTLFFAITFFIFQTSAYAESNSPQDLNTYKINMQQRFKSLEARVDSNTMAGQIEKLCFLRNEMLGFFNFAKEQSKYNANIKQNDLVEIRTQLNKLNTILKYKESNLCEVLK